MKGKSAPMRPRFKENMAGERLILPAIYPVPNSFCCSLRHIRTKERIVDIHIEVKRERSVFGHNILLTIYRQHLCHQCIIKYKPLNIHLIAHPRIVWSTGIIAARCCLWKAIPCWIVILGQHLCASLALVLLAGNK